MSGWPAMAAGVRAYERPGLPCRLVRPGLLGGRSVGCEAAVVGPLRRDEVLQLQRARTGHDVPAHLRPRLLRGGPDTTHRFDRALQVGLILDREPAGPLIRCG